jgi:hypothetical protein
MAARQILIGDAMPSRSPNGRALPAKLCFYQPNTAYSTPGVVYTSSALTTAHSWPLQSDSSGRFPAIWADEATSFDVTWNDLATGRQIRAYEDISPLSDAVLASTTLAQTAADQAEDSATAAAASATAAATAETAAEAAQAAAELARDEAEEIAGFDPTGYVQETRTVTGAGLVTGGGDLSANRTLTVQAAITADLHYLNSTTVAVTPDSISDALAEVTLTDAATIAVDLNTFINGAVTLGGNRTLGNPTNATAGKAGRIRVVQDATGSRTLAFSSNWKRQGGAPTLTTTAAAQDFIVYDVISPTYILYDIVKNPT